MRFIETLKQKAAEERREVLMRRFRIKVRNIHKSIFRRDTARAKELPAAHWSFGIEDVPYEEDREFPIQWL